MDVHLLDLYGCTLYTFGVHQCVVSKTLSEVCRAYKWSFEPKISIHERKSIKIWSKVWTLQAFGCTDGTHVPLKRLLINSQDFF